jgi:ATP-dependent helicase HrpA
VRRLLLKAMPQQTALVRDATLADRALVLAYHGLGPTAALVDDLLCASAERVFAFEPPIRDRTTFAARLGDGRAGFVAAAEELQALLRKILPLQRALRGALDKEQGAYPAARAEIAAQLDALVGPGLLTRTPPEWRKHLPRYLKAAEQRWHKRGQRQERELAAEVQAAAAPFERWRKALPPGWPWPPAIVEYRWLLEELRVSLFAQALGTQRPVSTKRLEQAWQRALAADAPGK